MTGASIGTRITFGIATARMPLGELSPMYFASPQARERIAKHLPECKIICSFRDPVERAYSNYRLLRRNAFTKADFERAATTRGDLLESSRYGTHLADWFDDLRPRASAGSDLR